MTISSGYGALTDDFSDDERAELGDLLPLYRALLSCESAEPTAESTTALLARLKPIMAARAAEAALSEVEDDETLPMPNLSARAWWRVARAQIELLPPGFWLAGAGVTLLGLAVGAVGGAAWLTTVIILFAPVLAAGGVAYAFRPETRGLQDLERISPVGTSELIYIRLGVVMAFNVVVALMLSVVMGISGAGAVHFGRLALVWLGPMVGLTGLALYLSVRWRALVGAFAPLTLWVGLLVFGWREASLQLTIAPSDNRYWALANWLLVQVNTADGLLFGAALMLAAGALLVRGAGRLAVQRGAV